MDFYTEFKDVFQSYPDDTLFEAATDRIVDDDVLSGDKHLALRFLRWFPRFYFLFHDSLQADSDVARVVITHSNGGVFKYLPSCIHENEELATLAWTLNPMMGHAIPFRIRRRICSPQVTRALCTFPSCRLTASFIKDIPKAAFRAYSREKLGERASFLAYLESNALPTDLNKVVADFLDLAVERAPNGFGSKRIYWIRLLKRGAI